MVALRGGTPAGAGRFLSFRQALRRSRDEVEAALWSGAFAALDPQYAHAWHARWGGEAQAVGLKQSRWWRRNAGL